MTMIHTSDDRLAKADRLAANVNQWLRCRSTLDGKKAFGVPSERVAGRYYLTTRSSCDCEDARRHPSQACKHQLAVQLVCARAAHQPMPAHAVVDGLTEMVAARDNPPAVPLLVAVRVDDDEIAFEHAPRRPTYDEIISKFFEGE